MELSFVMYLIAAVCFGAAAVGAAVGRVGLVPLGLLFWLLPTLIEARF